MSWPPETPPPAARSGVRTSEFWLALACLGAGVLLILRGHVEIGAGLVAIATAGHQASRTLVKRGGQQA